MSDEQRKEMENAASAAGNPEELTDEDLKQVSGGFTLTPVLEVVTPIPVANTSSSPPSAGGGTAASGWDLATNKPA